MSNLIAAQHVDAEPARQQHDVMQQRCLVDADDQGRGSSDSDVTAVAVIPCRRSWSAEVMTDTAAGNRRNARLNVSRNSSDAESSDMVSSTEIRSCPAA